MAIFDKEKLHKTKIKHETVKKHTIMIVDDEKAHLDSMQSLLSEDYQVITAKDGQEALDIIEEKKHPGEISVIISDQRMPGLSGIQLLEKIEEILPGAKRIILTSYDDKAVMLDAINKAKVDEFILKPFDPEDLNRRIKHSVEMFDLEKKLEKARLLDFLTGLKNQNYLYESIGSDTALVDRDFETWQHDSGKPMPLDKHLTFLFLNLDNFSSINNIYGHQLGDSVLKKTTEILQQECPKSDTLIRWGEDEFLIVSRFSERKQAKNLAERLFKSFQKPMVLENNENISVTCSIGFAPYPFIPTRADFTAFNWEKVLEIAEKALFAAKDLGGNTWVGILGTEKTKKKRIHFLNQVEREQLLDYIKQLQKTNEINVLSSDPQVMEPLMRQFFSYGQLDNNEHFHVPRKELIEKAYNHMVGRNPEKGGHYITVWGPRQTGKSWIMREVLQRLDKDPRFNVIKINLEDQKDKKNVGDIIASIARKIGEELDKTFTGVDNQEKFQEIFRKEVLEAPLILILDEFDSLPEDAINKIVSAFRNIYTTRMDQINKTTEQKKYLLHGLALIGIRSVLGIGNDKGSPFNVQKSLQIPNLTHNEVKHLFQWYKNVSNQEVKAEVVDRLYNETSGQPGLTCWFGELLTDGFKDYVNDTSQPIGIKEFEIVFGAATYTLPNNNILNIISKAKQESNIPLVLKMFRTNEKLRFRFDDPTISELYMNGVIDEEKEEDNRYYLKFSSPFIQKRLFNYFAGKYFHEMGQLVDPDSTLENVITSDSISIRDLMKLYQGYLEKNKSWLFKEAPRRSDQRIYEAIFHFNLYAYLDRFLQNKKGSVVPEFPTGNGKIDLIIKYNNIPYGIELKSFTDQPGYHQALRQAARYGKQLQLNEIYLVTFIETISEKMQDEYEKDFTDEDTEVTVKPIIIQTGTI